MDRSCPGRASTDKENAVIAENQRHDHPPESMQKIVSKVVNKMKDRAKNEMTSVNVIYREALQEVNENPDLHEAAAVLPTLPSLQSSLYQKRRERLPPLTRGNLPQTGKRKVMVMSSS